MLEAYRSFLDKNKWVYPNWVVSLVAKPRGRNPEHAFILVEGLTPEGNVCIRRYDFVVGDNNEEDSVVTLVKRRAGCVVIKETLGAQAEYDEAKYQRYFWANILKDIEQAQGCSGASWIITAEQAEALDAAVRADHITPPDYQISGDAGFLAASSSQSGHNCYTWSRKKLLDLNDKDISQDERLKLQLSDFIAERTTKHIHMPVEVDPSSPCCVM